MGLWNYRRLAVDKPKPVITADRLRWYCTLVESILEWPLDSLLDSLLESLLESLLGRAVLGRAVLGRAALGRSALRMEERFPREVLANGKL